ncbi:CBS domain-containing protein [Kitasatospora sp. NPDC086009]|uniref:CBS domain-containing protein n=1 Tax=unclassified Kitasatospora TaxID=2633591 RepID=UPI0036E31D55
MWAGGDEQVVAEGGDGDVTAAAAPPPPAATPARPSRAAPARAPPAAAGHPAASPSPPRNQARARTVRDIVLDRAPFATPDMSAATAAAAMRARGLAVWPVVDHDGHAIGLLTL